MRKGLSPTLISRPWADPFGRDYLGKHELFCGLIARTASEIRTEQLRTPDPDPSQDEFLNSFARLRADLQECQSVC